MHTIDYAKIPVQNNHVILDLGCGEGRHTLGAYAEYASAHNNLLFFALDLNLKDINTAKKRHEDFFNHSIQKNTPAKYVYTQGDGNKLPFADNSIDHIICSEVLEHIPEYTKFLTEMYRTLKVGGTLSISVPRAWPEKICWALCQEYHQVEGGHVHIFSYSQIKNAVLAYGYRFKYRHWAHSLHTPYWWLRCAFWKQGEHFFLARLYHKLLVWDLMKKPWLTQTLNTLLNPILGKSVVIYFEKTH